MTPTPSWNAGALLLCVVTAGAVIGLAGGGRPEVAHAAATPGVAHGAAAADSGAESAAERRAASRPGQQVSQPTRSVLTVTPRTGPAHGLVTLRCLVSGAARPGGTVHFTDGGRLLGSVPVTATADAVLTTTALADGEHDLGCGFVGVPPFRDSTSFPVVARYEPAGPGGPPGGLTLTTPYTPENPLHLGVAVLDQDSASYSAAAALQGVSVTDTRRGRRGFEVTAVASRFHGTAGGFPAEHAGLTDLVPTLHTGEVRHVRRMRTWEVLPLAPGLGRPTSIFRYPPGALPGRVDLAGVLRVAGIPTSVTPGRYTATLTLSVS